MSDHDAVFVIADATSTTNRNEETVDAEKKTTEDDVDVKKRNDEVAEVLEKIKTELEKNLDVKKQEPKDEVATDVQQASVMAKPVQSNQMKTEMINETTAAGTRTDVQENEHIISKEPKKYRIRLMTNDAKFFEVDKDVMMKSNLIRKWVEEGDEHLFAPFPLISIDAKTLKKVLEYFEKCATDCGNGLSQEGRVELTDQEMAFLNIPDKKLIKLAMAADYLQIPRLISIIAQRTSSDVEEGEFEPRPNPICTAIRKAFRWMARLFCC